MEATALGTSALVKRRLDQLQGAAPSWLGLKKLTGLTVVICQYLS
jgi:hypothetical protein